MAKYKFRVTVPCTAEQKKALRVAAALCLTTMSACLRAYMQDMIEEQGMIADENEQDEICLSHHNSQVGERHGRK